MSVVKRTKDGIDMIEHAMQGVQISENRVEIVRFYAEPGIVGVRSKTEVRALEDPRVEREVIVKMPREPRRRRSR
jgi:hypothetical protein